METERRVTGLLEPHPRPRQLLVGTPSGCSERASRWPLQLVKRKARVGLSSEKARQAWSPMQTTTTAGLRCTGGVEGLDQAYRHLLLIPGGDRARAEPAEWTSP